MAAPNAAPPLEAVSASVLQIRRYDSLVDCAHLRAEINALNMQSARPSPYATFEFLEICAEHDEHDPGGDRSTVLMLVAMQGARLIGYLPLRRDRVRLLGLTRHQIDWLVRHEGDRPQVVAAPEDETRCANAFVDWLVHAKNWTLLSFSTQDERSALNEAVTRVPRRAYHVRRLPGNPNCTIDIAWATLDEYFRACSKNKRASVGNTARRLLAQGAVEWIRSTDAASGEELFASYLELERRSWKRGLQVAIERNPTRVAFYRALFADELPMRSAVHLLTLDQVPVAGIISVSFAGGVYSQEMVYDERLNKLSPGNLAHLLMMHECIRAGARFYNLKVLFAYYKESWLARTAETSTLQIFRRPSLHYLKLTVGEWRRRVRGSAAEPLDHNPDKRAAVDGAPAAAPEAWIESNETVAARDRLVAARSGGLAIAVLSDEEVRAVMPWRK